MIAATQSIEDMTLNIEQETRVNAPLDITFTALLEQLGANNETPEGKPMPMVIEAWPGGRWYRDLGGDNGHHWGHVQAIKRPTLLEVSGPLFMSYPVANNVQYRLSEEAGVTTIKFRHVGFGLIPEDHKKGVSIGWSYMLEQMRKRAEKSH
jgi:uncharacterized protein YndB with AHSA1/START domain